MYDRTLRKMKYRYVPRARSSSLAEGPAVYHRALAPLYTAAVSACLSIKAGNPIAVRYCFISVALARPSYGCKALRGLCGIEPPNRYSYQAQSAFGLSETPVISTAQKFVRWAHLTVSRTYCSMPLSPCLRPNTALVANAMLTQSET